MPFFTQAFTRQPVFADASGSAARISPAFSASLNCWNRLAMLVACTAPDFRRTSCSISACSIDLLDQAQGFEHAANFREIFRLHRHQRQPANRFAEAHQRHARFHRSGIRLDEVDFHQAEVAPLEFARCRRNRWPARVAPGASSRREFRSRPPKSGRGRRAPAAEA